MISASQKAPKSEKCDGVAEDRGGVARLRERFHHPARDDEEREPERGEEVGRERPREARLAVAPEVGLVAPHREADHGCDCDPERQAAAARRAAELAVVADHRAQDHVDAPEDQDRRHEIAREDADPREAEEVVQDHHAGEHEREREDVAPAVEAVPEAREQVRLECDPAERRDEDERGDDPRAPAAEDRPREERVRLPRARAEVRAGHRIGDVHPVADERDRDRRREAVAAVVDLEAEEHVGEAGDERRPEPQEVPHGAAPVERNDAGVGGRIVVRDRLVERRALEREVVSQILFDLVRPVVPVVVRHAVTPLCGLTRFGASLRAAADGFRTSSSRRRPCRRRRRASARSRSRGRRAE